MLLNADSQCQGILSRGLLTDSGKQYRRGQEVELRRQSVEARHQI